MKLHKDSNDRFFDHNYHLETRTIFLGDSSDEGVGPYMAEIAIKAITLMQAADPTKPIKIIMNTMGGSWYDGMAIHDVIAASPCHVTIEAIGSCMSMGSIILQAADERVLHPNVCFMIHDGSDYFEGHAKDFQAWGQHSEKLRYRMYELYASKSHHPVKFWAKKCAHDLILTAKEAIELGLADRIHTREVLE